jgi:hypothetical protein
MNEPEILGRVHGESNDQASSRAGTSAGPQMSIPYTSGAIGEVNVQIFTSNDDEDRGGVVIRLSVEDQSSSFIPAVRVMPTGVEIHMAGDAEAACLIRALRGVLAALPEPSRYKGVSV